MTDKPQEPKQKVSKTIIDTVLTNTSTVNFNSWKYGNTKVTLEFASHGGSITNIAQYKVLCDKTIVVPDFVSGSYLGLDGKHYKKVTEVNGVGWISQSYEDEPMKTTFEVYGCEGIHFYVDFAPYFKGTINFKAAVLSV